GVGTSQVVSYEGNGVYFLDKLENGVWRMEVMPDVIHLSDPFATASPRKKVNAIEWNKNRMKVVLPDLGSKFTVNGINDGNDVSFEVKDGSFRITPGSYILKSVERKTFDVSSKAKIAGIYIDEFVAPKPDKL